MGRKGQETIRYLQLRVANPGQVTGGVPSEFKMYRRHQSASAQKTTVVSLDRKGTGFRTATSMVVWRMRKQILIRQRGTSTAPTTEGELDLDPQFRHQRGLGETKQTDITQPCEGVTFGRTWSMIDEHVHQLHVDLCSTEALGKLHIHLSGELHRGRNQLHIGVSRIEKPIGLSV